MTGGSKRLHSTVHTKSKIRSELLPQFTVYYNIARTPLAVLIERTLTENSKSVLFPSVQ